MGLRDKLKDVTGAKEALHVHTYSVKNKTENYIMTSLVISHTGVPVFLLVFLKQHIF